MALNLKILKKTENEDSDNKIAETEQIDDNTEFKPNIFDKAMENRKVANAINITKNNKKIIICDILLLVGLIMTIAIGNLVVFDKDQSIFGAMYNQSVKDYNTLKNDIDIFEKTNPYYTLVTDNVSIDQNKDVNWIGDKLDVGRWQVDDAYFWNWISPAFDFDSATEYEQNINDFKTIKKIPADHMFLASFLERYDYKSDLRYDRDGDGSLSVEEAQQANLDFNSTTDKSLYFTMPIGMNAKGDYHYLAIVPKETNSHKASYIAVAFTFTAQHNINPTTNSDTIEIVDFNIWSPDTKRLMYLK